MGESSAQRLLLARAPHAIPALRLFRRNVVAAETKAGTFVRAGIKGQADLYGYLQGSPAVPVEIELKSARGKPSPEQLAWESFCRRMGVPYLRLSAAKNETEDQTVARWILELKTLLGLT